MKLERNLSVNDTEHKGQPVRLVMVGTGLMGQHHLKTILKHSPATSIPVICEPSEESFLKALELFDEYGRAAPENIPDLDNLLSEYNGDLDAAFLITPHAVHHDQTMACMEAGLDVLVEKPMVINAQEARSLIDARDRTGRLLVIGFNGGLSPAVHRARELVRSGEAGELISVSAAVWQNWRQLTAGTWRQNPEVSGGGFLFDTGAHMLNTVAEIVDQDFVEAAAWFDNRQTAVEINGAAMARLASGALVSFHGSGETIPTCASSIQIFCSKMILHTNVWGHFLEFQESGSDEFLPVKLEPSFGVWDEFLAIREGKRPNSAPPEVGLRFSHIYDALKTSAERGGQPVPITPS